MTYIYHKWVQMKNCRSLQNKKSMDSSKMIIFTNENIPFLVAIFGPRTCTVTVPKMDLAFF